MVVLCDDEREREILCGCLCFCECLWKWNLCVLKIRGIDAAARLRDDGFALANSRVTPLFLTDLFS